MSLDLLAEAPSPGPGTYHVMAPQRDLLRPYLLSCLVVVSTTLLLLTGSHQTSYAGVVLALLTCLCVLCSQQFTDLASLSALAKYTTGGVYCYPGFNQARDAPKLQTEIKHNLTRPTGLLSSSLCM